MGSAPTSDFLYNCIFYCPMHLSKITGMHLVIVAMPPLHTRLILFPFLYTFWGCARAVLRESFRKWHASYLNFMRKPLVELWDHCHRLPERWCGQGARWRIFTRISLPAHARLEAASESGRAPGDGPGGGCGQTGPAGGSSAAERSWEEEELEELSDAQQRGLAPRRWRARAACVEGRARTPPFSTPWATLAGPAEGIAASARAQSGRDEMPGELVETRTPSRWE
ncbi:unnamed protein product, partial [Prorocentrum cordatum]